MRSYRITIRPLSAWASPWRADTLFGCLCWAWRDFAGEARLLQWLRRFREDQPPFVVSDAFPSRCLPAPLGAPVAAPRKSKPPLWVTVEDFVKICQGTGQEVQAVSDGKPAFRRCDRLQASLGRLSDTTTEGQLFEIEQQHLNPEFSGNDDGTLSVYLRIEDEQSLDEVHAAFRSLAWKGFGKKSSSGLGAFELAGGPVSCEWLDANNEDAEGFVALSHFVPAATDPSSGRWRTHVSHPKFHGNQVREFLKGRVVTLTPGSVFRTDAPVNHWYGRMVPMPRPGMVEAVHYGLCFPAPLRAWPEANGARTS